MFNRNNDGFGFVGVIVKAMFIIVPILMVAGIIWNYQMYQDCRSHGHAAYQCSAMISANQHYVAVDNFGNN